ncbi:hypothetical protein FZEAL_7396 [Fusarium zealandicum]|uniref:WSC domain-containing protein n=1 Tax=Fusarium zealandicum TaxID=1053134 RepID=A0A8H4XIW9_9HYPO|nr:hypothetical protein FZEAL_7396 [Fusarium zealandicum]
MVNYNRALLVLLVATSVEAFWRLSCSIIQTGRVDPIINPGKVAGHLHKVSGASNFGVDSSYDDLQASRCTSCEVQTDKSAYWTPQLFYQHGNGSFEMVPNGGTVIYYLGRGENRSNIEPFPPGFQMLSGDNFARSNDLKTMTYSKKGYKGRPLSERVSFACLDSSGPSKERNYMWKTECDNGMRAQIHFQTCWNGGEYQADQSHVAYMSQIDNGICPPTHPRQLPHLFFEVIYGVNQIQKTKGGRFVFSNGDTTGYSFHGDFLNGWDKDVLKDAIKKCINNDSIGGSVAKCPPLAVSQTPYFSDNCPEMDPLIDEPIRGLLDALPGCNPVQPGPERASPVACDLKPAINDLGDAGLGTIFKPAVGDKVGAWAYFGCATEGVGFRALNKYAVSSNAMTIEYCTASCKAQGYLLAGMENTRECYCANVLTSGTSYLKAASCAALPKMACRGNTTQFCGGPNTLTVWKDTSYTPPQDLVIGQTKISNGMATYMGCYSEPPSGRALSLDRIADTVGMTNEKCVEFCQAGGYTYAGTEYSQECYCGNTINGDSLPDISQCSMQCRGNIFSYCGAGNRLSVWKVDQPEKPTGPITAFNGAALYMGCFTDGGDGGRTLAKASFTGSAVSLDTCFAFCKRNNYPLFGMEYGQECYCGSAPKTQATLTGDGECRMPCKGDPSQKCGAGNRISIWNNTEWSPMARPETKNIQHLYEGCYTEGRGRRALASAKASDSRRMTVEVCSKFCYTKGYAYMGLENGQDCFCNNAGPSSGSKKALESDCGMPCKGNKSQYCGNRSRLNVYKLVGKPATIVKAQAFSSTTRRLSSSTTFLTRTTSASKVVSKGKTSSTTTTRPRSTSRSTTKTKASSTTTTRGTTRSTTSTKATSTSKVVNVKAARVSSTTTSKPPTVFVKVQAITTKTLSSTYSTLSTSKTAPVELAKAKKTATSTSSKVTKTTKTKTSKTTSKTTSTTRSTSKTKPSSTATSTMARPTTRSTTTSKARKTTTISSSSLPQTTAPVLKVVPLKKGKGKGDDGDETKAPEMKKSTTKTTTMSAPSTNTVSSNKSKDGDETEAPETRKTTTKKTSTTTTGASTSNTTTATTKKGKGKGGDETEASETRKTTTKKTSTATSGASASTTTAATTTTKKGKGKDGDENEDEASEIRKTTTKKPTITGTPSTSATSTTKKGKGKDGDEAEASETRKSTTTKISTTSVAPKPTPALRKGKGNDESEAKATETRKTLTTKTSSTSTASATKESSKEGDEVETSKTTTSSTSTSTASSTSKSKGKKKKKTTTTSKGKKTSTSSASRTSSTLHSGRGDD